MGWDGFAHPKPSVKQRMVFRAAAEDIRDRVGSVDGMLFDGIGLDCSDCAIWMENLTGCSAYESWSPDQMKARYETAKLLAASDEEYGSDAWARESALAFMRLCAEFGLGMRASY